MCLSGNREIWNWGCSECRGADFADQDGKRWGRNCDGRTKQGPFFHAPWAPDRKTCPWKDLADNEIWDYVSIWREWKDYGVLPERGDILEQRGDVMEAVMLCDNILAEVKAAAEAGACRDVESAKSNLERKIAAKKGRT